jgi:hypothetical protein
MLFQVEVGTRLGPARADSSTTGTWLGRHSEPGLQTATDMNGDMLLRFGGLGPTKGRLLRTQLARAGLAYADGGLTILVISRAWQKLTLERSTPTRWARLLAQRVLVGQWLVGEDEHRGGSFRRLFRRHAGSPATSGGLWSQAVHHRSAFDRSRTGQTRSIELI